MTRPDCQGNYSRSPRYLSSVMTTCGVAKTPQSEHKPLLAYGGSGVSPGRFLAHLSKVASRTLEWTVEEVEWSWRESHFMIVQDTYPQSISALPYSEQVGHPCVVYNPLYWIGAVTTAPCVLLGRWVHAAVGQGGPVRDDELQIERVARIHWIYTTDGPFALSAILTMIYLIWLAFHSGRRGTGVDVAGTVVDIAIDIFYITGNVAFLEAMRKKRVSEVRMCIFCNFTFATGLATLLVSGILRTHLQSDWSWSRRATWTLRFLSVLFFAAATFIYSRLWNAYGSGQHDDRRKWSYRLFVEYAVIVSAALGVWLLLAVVTILGSPTYLWEAVA